MGKSIDKMTWEERHTHYDRLWTDWVARNLEECNVIASIDHAPREIAVEGKCVLYCPGDPFWGGDEARDYYSPILNNPTWGTVMRYFNRAVPVTRDRHHVFLEGVYEAGRSHRGVPVIEFATGS